MLFNSFGYVFVFLPVTAVSYALIRRYIGSTSSQIWLLLCSLFFYSYSKPSNLVLLLGSIVFNWAVGRLLSRELLGQQRFWIFLAGLVVDIGFLFSFKYVNLFLAGLAAFHGPRFSLPDLEFPLGISFFTLSQIMYLVDTYEAPDTANSFLDHLTFVSFFAYVTSGPISRSMEVVPQFHNQEPSQSRWEMACRGLFLFSMGLVKKVMFADSFAQIANQGFQNGVDYSTVEAWLFTLAFTFQIYFDFSGYSDMALGSAWMLGIDIPKNFDAPFRSLSISEYWQRWHISLSAFITNYLYTPLLRSFGGRATLSKSVAATVAAMTIAGIWHGPSWTFALYGLAHGIALAINQIWKRRKLKMPDAVAWVCTFGFVVMSFVLFRSPNLPTAIDMYAQMLPHHNLLGLDNLRRAFPLTAASLLRPALLGLFVVFFFKTTNELAERMPLVSSRALATAALFVLAMFFMNSTPAKTFIYFAF